MSDLQGLENLWGHNLMLPLNVNFQKKLDQQGMPLFGAVTSEVKVAKGLWTLLVDLSEVQ